MKKVLSLVLAAAMAVGMAATTFAAKKDMISGDAVTALMNLVQSIEDKDDVNLIENGWNGQDAIDVEGDKSYTLKYDLKDTAFTAETAFAVADLDNITVSVKASNGTYLECDVDEVAQKIYLDFSNTTFKDKEVKLEITLKCDGFNNKTFKVPFTVAQAQDKNFKRVNAIAAFKEDDDITVNASDYAAIKAGAFDVMLADENRTITVVTSNAKIKFDSDSENLDSDLWLKATVKSSKNEASISMDDNEATGKIKIAVGKAFYDAFKGEDLVVYKDGKATDIKATLKGDYTVNFVGALGSYVIAGKDYADATDSSASTDKDNPGMGSNDVVGVAVALAAMSLVAAGAVAFKKVK